MKILTKYILKEQLFPFLTGFFFISFLMILNKLFVLAEYFISKDIEFFVILKFFLLLFPITMIYSVPISALYSSIMAIGRLSNDSEIIAMKAAGISFFRILRPVIISGFVLFILMIVFYETVFVYCNRNQVELAVSNPAILLDEGVFTDLGGRTLWIEKINRKTNELRKILLFNKKENTGWEIISAEKGILQENSDRSKSLILFSGKVYGSQVNSGNFSVIDFSGGSAEYLISSQNLNMTSGDELNPDKMTSISLYKYLKSKQETYRDSRAAGRAWVDLFKKMSIPFSCFVFTIIGAPLGVSYRRNARGMGFGLSIVVVLIYYMFFTGGQQLSIRGLLHPFFGVWIANFVLLLAGILLIIFKERAK
jgi:LPS export ABC transporter permease LptF